MNFIDRLIVNRANSIKQKEERRKAGLKEKEQKDKEARLELLESDRLFLRKCVDNINIELEKVIEYKMKEKEGLRIKAGDEAVVNIYNLAKDSRNGWDGGAGVYLDFIPKGSKLQGVKVKITEVYLDRSFTDELVDRFLNKYTTQELKKITYNGSMVWQGFCDFTNKRAEGSMFGRFGFYWAAKFQTRIPFQPKWGLNINSFFVKGEKGYDETLELVKLEDKREKIQKEKDQIIQDLGTKMYQIKSTVV